MFQFCTSALFFFIYSLNYLHLIRSPNPLVFIFIYSLHIPWSLIFSIFTFLIMLKDLYKMWWNQYFKIEKEKIKEGYDLLLILKKNCFQRNKKILFGPKVWEIVSLESIIALKVLSTLKVVAPLEFVLKRHLGGLEEEGIYKPSFTSTFEKCETILTIR